MSNKNPVVHFEMPYKDADRLSKFYEQAFSWSMNKLGKEMGGYVLAGTTEMDENFMVKTPGTINGGFFPKDMGTHLGTSVVISVDNLKDHMKRVTDAGGELEGEPMDIPGIGTYISFIDTEGNRVGMLQPVMDK